jgi:succinoglycan biosynthesis protein ExoL
MVTKVAFFGHDSTEPAIRKRVRGFRADGMEVLGFMMRRGPSAPEWPNIDLGLTHDARYLRRLLAVLAGAMRAGRHGALLRGCDAIYARNLDMLAVSFLSRALSGSRAPVIYECLDVHRLLTRDDMVGRTLRAIEGWLLKRCAALVVSSPAFLTEHFAPRYGYEKEVHLVENRLAQSQALPPRPQGKKDAAEGRLTVGWVGVLRCARTLDLLVGAARALGPRVAFRLHGKPALTEIPDFFTRISGIDNIAYRGPYRAPEDLASVYDGLDIVWAGDFMEAGFNSVWLLPNRLYEGGYFATPAFAPQGTQTAAWLTAHKAGFAVDEPLETTLTAFLAGLADNPEPLNARKASVCALPVSAFVQPRGELAAIIDAALGRQLPSSRARTS